MRDGWRIIMVKKTETIQVRLTNYGTIEVVSIPTRIYKDSYNVMRLSCIVPKVEETGARICKVYATDVDEAGNTIFTSQAHFLPQLREKDGSEKIIKINGFDYIIYEDRLPEEFCKDTGNITLNFAEGIIDGENEIVRNNVSGQLNLFISGDGYNYNGVKISNYDVVASRIDAIYKTSENALKVAEEAKDAVVQGEGTKVTLNGVLQPTWSADFAESERQKSKNLFNAKDVSVGDKLYGYVPIKNVKDVYTLSLQNGKTNYLEGIAFGICKDPTDQNTVQLGYTWLIETGIPRITTINATITDRPYVFFYPNNKQALDTIINNFDIQIEEGSIATEYQAYNGAIVHEKQLNEAVEKRELFYDAYNTIHIGDSTLTTLSEYVDLFRKDLNKIYTCAIGNVSTSNFKTLVGNPFGYNYTACYIKAITNNLDGLMLFELLALDYFTPSIAKGYIYVDGNNTVTFKGWNVIGG